MSETTTSPLPVPTVAVPTVGRIVHYRARGSADGVFPPVCRAAIVTESNAAESTTVGLAVANPTGLFFDRGVSAGPGLQGGSWHWPGRDGDCEVTS